MDDNYAIEGAWDGAPDLTFLVSFAADVPVAPESFVR